MQIYYFQVCSLTQTTELRLPSGTDCPPSRGNHSGYIFQYLTHVHFCEIMKKYVNANADAPDNAIKR